MFVWIARDDVYSLITLIDFYANSLVRPKELAKKGRQGSPLGSPLPIPFQYGIWNDAIISLTLACQNPDKRAVGWFSEYCLGLRVFSKDSLA